MRRNYSLYGKFRNKANDAWLMPKVRVDGFGVDFNRLKDEDGEEYISDLILFKHYLPVKTEKYTRFSFEDGVENYRVEGVEGLQDVVRIPRFEEDRDFTVEYSLEDEHNPGSLPGRSGLVSLMRYSSYIYAVDRQSRVRIYDRWTGALVKEASAESGVKIYDVGRMGKYVHISCYKGKEERTSSERMNEDYWHGGGYADHFQRTVDVYTCVFDPLMTNRLYVLGNVAQIIYFGDEYLITLHRLSDARLEYALFQVKDMTDEQVYSALQSRTLKGRVIDNRFFDGNEVVKVVDMCTFKDGTAMARTTDKVLMYSKEEKAYRDISRWNGSCDQLNLAVRELVQRIFYKIFLAPDTSEIHKSQVETMVVKQSMDRALAEKENVFKIIERDELSQRACFHGHGQWNILDTKADRAREQMKDIDRYITWCRKKLAVPGGGPRETWMENIKLIMDFSESMAYAYEEKAVDPDNRPYYQKEDEFVNRFSPSVVRDMAINQQTGSQLLLGLLFEPDGGFSQYGEKTVENAVRMCIGEPEHFNEFSAKYWPNEYEMDQGEE